MDQSYWSRLYYSHFIDNEMEAQIQYIHLASNRPGFESQLCCILTLYLWAKSVLLPLLYSKSIFPSNRQSTSKELIFCGPSTSATWSLLWTIRARYRPALSSLWIYSHHIRMHTLALKPLVPRVFRAYCSLMQSLNSQARELFQLFINDLSFW